MLQDLNRQQILKGNISKERLKSGGKSLRHFFAKKSNMQKILIEKVQKRPELKIGCKKKNLHSYTVVSCSCCPCTPGVSLANHQCLAYRCRSAVTSSSFGTTLSNSGGGGGPLVKSLIVN
jgi:hypothetical protein